MKKVAFGVILSSILVACGSGGSDSPQEPPQPLAKYVGTWDSSCQISNNFWAAGVTTYSSVDRLTFTLNADGSLASQYATHYFDSAVCGGVAVGILNDPLATIRFESSKTVGSDAVELTTYNRTLGNITHTGSAASTVTTGGTQQVQVTFGFGAGMIAVSRQLTQSASSDKSATKIDSARNTLTVAEAPLDAAGYPTNFSTPPAFVYTKQPALAATNPLAKYVGSWTNACESSFAPSTSRNTLITQTLQVNGDLAIANTYRYFNGLACSGATIAEIVFPINTVRFNSTVTVNGVSVDRGFYTEPAGSITATGSIVSSNATQWVMTYPGGSSTEPLTQTGFSTKAAFKAVGTTQFSSAKNPADSAGYPATFAATPTYTKQ